MLTVRDLMTREVTTVAAEESLRDAVDRFATTHVSGAPVMAGDRVLGVLSASDILAFEAETPGVPTERPALEQEAWSEPPEWVEGEEAPAAFFSEQWSDAGADALERFVETGSPEWDRLAEHTVGEAMSRIVCSIRPTASVYAAADYMSRAGVHRLIVVDRGRLVGILSSLDIVRAVAQQRLVAGAAERRVRSRPWADARR